MNSGTQNRLEHAQVELSQHVGEMIKPYTANNLWSGLTTLRELLLTRLHSDVAVEFGIDSAVAPATEFASKPLRRWANWLTELSTGADTSMENVPSGRNKVRCWIRLSSRCRRLSEGGHFNVENARKPGVVTSVGIFRLPG